MPMQPMSDRAEPTARGAGYCVFDTQLGVCGIAWSERGLTRLQLPEADPQATMRRLRAGAGGEAPSSEPPPRWVAGLIGELRRYFAGERVEFTDVAIDLAGANEFQHKLYDLTRAVGWGRTTTYGELARQAGDPGASRAVGQAMGHNPVPIIIPCHRVLAAGRKIGGFSAYGGAVTKERLLALEGVYPGDGTPPLPGLLPGR